MQKRVYFSIADRQLESFSDPALPTESAFEKSLLLNILFQSGILIPDIFCFISKGLEAHIKKCQTRKSLFEACVEKNLVTPVFRDPSVSSFQDVLFIIRGQGEPKRAIQGIRNSAEEIAQRLQLAAESNVNFSPAYWPQAHIGEKFDQVISQYLMCSEPPNIDENSGINRHELQGIWSLTKKWRLDCILEARDATQKLGDKGLRRGEIMNAVGRNLGLPKGYLVHDVAELFSLPESPQEKRAIRLFCRWMTECYQYNQAVEFGCTASFPGYDSLGSLMTISALPSKPVYPDLVVPTIRERVAHPPLNTLLKIAPNELLEIRQDLGLGYFAALATWQAQPTNTNEQEVRRTVREYSAELVKWATKKQTFTSAILDVVHVANTERSQQVLSSAINILKTLPIPVVETLIVLLEESFAVHRIYSPPQDHNQIEFEAIAQNIHTLPEVNISSAGNEIKKQ